MSELASSVLPVEVSPITTAPTGLAWEFGTRASKVEAKVKYPRAKSLKSPTHPKAPPSKSACKCLKKDWGLS
ncbi:MAG: hypothetical protein NTX25_17265 [Proteobacteria bacterium]|nr:hypothetical protein [Pseudomonadota bacterium]